MAEVQRRLEAITVELEELTQVGFFTEPECTSLVKKQFEFENKINSMNKSVQDFKDYIAYVIALYRIIQIRRNKSKIGDKKHNLEYRVLQRIKNLYEMAATRFSQEIDLFFGFFQFCKEASFEHATNKMCNMMIKFHQNKEEVWLTAARLYFHERNDSSKAIKLLQQGIGILYTGPLYTECIQYEITAALTQLKNTQTDDEEYKNEIMTTLLKKIEIYIKQSQQQIDDYSFYTNLLEYLQKFDFSNNIQIQIIDHLMEQYANVPESWNYLATRELHGLHYNEEKNILETIPKTKGFINALAMYEKGLNNVYFDKRQQMWTFYAECMVEIKNSSDFEKITNYPQLALSVYERAASENGLLDQYYLHYLDLVNDNKKIDVLKEANTKLPKSLDLWVLRMRIEIARNIDADISSTFKTAYENLGDDAGPIWDIMHDYIKANKDKNVEDITKFYELAIKQNGCIGGAYMSKYIEWLSEINMDECRQVYESLSNKSFNEDMYMKMLELEKQMKNNSKLEAVHKAACKKVGYDNVNVWLNFIKFLIDWNQGSGAKEAISKLVIEVRRKLNCELHEEFQHQYDDVMQELVAKRGLKRKHV